MTRSTCTYTATKPNKLRWAIALAILGSTHAQAEVLLRPETDNPQIIDHSHAAPVVNIAAPDANGLSHNKFLDYNVGQVGLVLNNALGNGLSTLVGELSANPRFQSQAASTILNEVVGHSASLIAGPQEIFGQRADYLLANPNGIAVNGGHFINTATASLVVGTPVFQDNKLHRLSTEHAKGALQVQARDKDNPGLRNMEGALHLIAPRLDSTGQLAAKDELQVVVGRNRVDSATAEIAEIFQPESVSIDAQLLGAMNAGRIRLKSTALGAGVRMGPTWVTSGSDISLESAGALDIVGEHDRPVYLDAKHGALSLRSVDDMQLTSVGARAQHIAIESGNKLNVNASGLNLPTQSPPDHITKYEANKLRSAGDVTLTSADHMKLTGVQVVAAGTLHLESNDSVEILAGLYEGQSEQDAEDHHSIHTRQTAISSRLQAQDIDIEAAADLIVRGSALNSSGALKANAKTVTLEHQTLFERSDTNRQSGHLNSTYTWSAAASALQGQSLDIRGEDVRITNSHLTSYGDAHLEASAGPLVLESAETTTRSSQFTPGLTFFDKPIGHESTQTTSKKARHSTVTSQGNLALKSAGELRIHGADLKATRDLSLRAGGELTLDSSTSSLASTQSILDPGFAAGIRETLDPQDGKPGSRQWEFYVGIERPEQTTEKSETTQNASTVKGATVSLESGSLVLANGAQISASQGDLTLKGPTVSISAAYDKAEGKLQLSNLGAGLSYSAGVERIGSAWEGSRENQMSHATISKALLSELSANGNITITSDRLLTEGARVTAGKALQIDTGNISNRAAKEVVERTSLIDRWRASIGVSLEYFGWTKPIIEVIDNKPADRFQQASIEEALSPPSIGVDVTWRMKDRVESEHDSRAKVSELNGATIKVNADVIDDQGTVWRANTGTLDITARQHLHLAAENSSERHVKNLDASADLRVDTTTGKDVGIRIAGKSEALDSLQSTSTAVRGHLDGHGGVSLKLSGDGLYKGSQITSKDGKVTIRAGGDLAFTPGTDVSGSTEEQVKRNGRIKLSTKPGEKGGEARGYVDLNNKYTTQTTAQVAQIDSKGEVMISSGLEQSHEGTRINSEQGISLYSGKRLSITEARNVQQVDGNRYDGGFELVAKLGATRGGGLGGHLGTGTLDENDSQAVGAILSTEGKLTLSSRAQDDQALHLRGVQASSGLLDLQAGMGGMLIEASDDRELHDSLDVTGGLGVISTKGGTDTRGIFARAKVELDRRDNQTWNASTLKANHINLNSLGDTRLEGVSLQTGTLDAKIGGDLHIASRQDKVNTLTVKTDLGGSHERNPQGFLTAVNAVGGRWGKEAKEQLGDLHKQSEHGTLMVDVLREVRDDVQHQAVIAASEGMNLKVGGTTRLVGARLESAAGDVNLETGETSTETLNGSSYHRAVAVNLTNYLPELVMMVGRSAQNQDPLKGENPVDLLLLKTSGHAVEGQWTPYVKGQID
ncbi:hemagglutinin repeat-containing protein [Pseudomonas xantholysinigenes]|uniref:Hemagglutinin repeat-containing protein n=1 Tax=Pseudomonas xantholysinigenes TaxID=2745490 RepID=A0A9E6TWG3_9PSED|nr:hemagglutinin repeat-containing protein [Pseudomonas xantholysinigenes]QXI37492.1 hemagglutinin repeat-containing protein [Pseudomonas xantholysinigenes]